MKFWIVASIAAIVLTACGDSGIATPTPTPSPTLSGSLYGWSFEGDISSGYYSRTVREADGSYRQDYIAYSSFDPFPKAGKNPYVGTRVSKDGLSWTEDGKISILSNVSPPSPPTPVPSFIPAPISVNPPLVYPLPVLLSNGQFRGYTSGLLKNILVLDSIDAKVWRPDATPLKLPALNPGCLLGDVVQLSDQTFRMFITCPNGQRLWGYTQHKLDSLSSKDGYSWSLDSGDRLDPVNALEQDPGSIGHPVRVFDIVNPRILVLGDGSLKIFYSGGGDEIWSAQSSDLGLSWTNRTWEHIFGANPDGIVYSNGTIRLFTSFILQNYQGKSDSSRLRLWSYLYRPLDWVLQGPGYFEPSSINQISTTINIAGSSHQISLSVRDLFPGDTDAVNDPKSSAWVTLAPSNGLAPMESTVSIDVQSAITAVLVIANDGAIKQLVYISFLQVPLPLVAPCSDASSSARCTPPTPTMCTTGVAIGEGGCVVPKLAAADGAQIVCWPLLPIDVVIPDECDPYY